MPKRKQRTEKEDDGGTQVALAGARLCTVVGALGGKGFSEEGAFRLGPGGGEGPTMSTSGGRRCQIKRQVWARFLR